VRVGDVIDYAYSRKGMNPVFGGRFTGTVPVQLSEPADRLITRVLWPRQRRLRGLERSDVQTRDRGAVCR